MRVGKHLGRSKQADQGKTMTRSAYLQTRIFRLHSKVIPEASVESEKRGVRGTSPGKLRGLAVMAPRHIDNPSILRGRGRFPV